MPRKTRRSYSQETKEAIVREILSSKQPAAQARAAEKHEVSQATISQWTIAYKAEHPNWEQEINGPASKTLMSSPLSSPPSGVQTPLPELKIAIDGLEAYIDARVQAAVQKAFARMLAG